MIFVRGDNGEIELVDDHIKYRIRDFYQNKLSSAIKDCFDNETVFMLYVQAWRSLGFEGIDAELEGDDALLERGRLYMPIWRIYIESDKPAEELEAQTDRLIEEIEKNGLCGRYYIYMTECEVLLLMDNENYMEYLPDNENADGTICKYLRRFDLTNGVEMNG